MGFMRHAIRVVSPRALVFAALGLAAPILGVNGAAAQQPSMIDLSDPYVTVDLSVIDDGGVGLGPSLAIPGVGRRLLMPGLQRPISKLHVPPPKRRARRAASVPKEKKVSRRSTPAPTEQISRPAPPPMAPPPPPMAKTRPAPPKATAAVKSAPPSAAKAAPPPPPVKAPAKPKVTKAAAKPPPPPAAARPKAPAAKPKAPVAKTAAAPPPPPPPPTTRAAKAPEKKPEAKQVASLPPAAVPLAPGQAMKVVYSAGATKLPSSVRNGLKALAGKMKGRDKLRIQLMAYAGGDGLSASRARRISLSRALAVRSYMIESGVRSTRIDVRALGNKTSSAPVNRVDVMVVER